MINTLPDKMKEKELSATSWVTCADRPPAMPARKPQMMYIITSRAQHRHAKKTHANRVFANAADGQAEGRIDDNLANREYKQKDDRGVPISRAAVEFEGNTPNSGAGWKP